MANLVISGDTSGSVTLSAPAVSGTTVLTLPTTSGTILTTAGGAAGSFTTLTSSGASSFATSSGDVGIGTASPSGKIDVRATGDGARIANLFNTTQGFGFRVRVAGSDSLLEGVNVAENAYTSTRIIGGPLSLETASTILFSNAGGERMRITDTGDVGIGTSSPGARLEVAGSINTNDSAIRLTNNAVGTEYVDIQSGINGVANSGFQVSVNGTARMVVNNSGNVGIGTTSPETYTNWTVLDIRGGTNGGFLQVSDGTIKNSLYNGSSTGFVGTQSSHPLAFVTGGTEKIRIDTTGNLMIGTTSTNETSGTGARLGADGYVRSTRAGSNNQSSTLDVYSTGASLYRFYVDMAGTVFATNTTITAISDQRLKENITDIDVGLDAVMALKPRKFDWKTGKGKDKKGDRGWIAQEFETVFPEMIQTWKDPAPKGEEPYKAVNADLIPVLVKAIQEQQAIITQLQLDVAALKGAA